MATKTKVMMFITIIVVSLSISAILYILMDTCDTCDNRFCFGTCVIEERDAEGNVIVPKKPTQQKTNQSATRLTLTERADDSYLHNLVFIGDSRTVAFQNFESLNEENVFAAEGLNHEDALYLPVVQIQDYKLVSIPEAVKASAPDIMVINFGINGISWMNVEPFILGYEEFIDALIEVSPHSIIVIEAILPVSLSYEQREDGVSNGRGKRPLLLRD